MSQFNSETGLSLCIPTMNYYFFEKLDLSREEVDTFLTLYRLGIQPASTVAKHVGIERTKTYRHLLKLAKLGIVRKTSKNGIQVFFVKDLGDLEKAFQKKVDDLAYIENERRDIISSIEKMKIENSALLPKITLYDGSTGVGNIFDDILETMQLRGYLTLRMFATNTFMERNEDETAGKYASSFFEKLRANGVQLDTYLGSGNLMMERVQHVMDSMKIEDIPATGSSINIILAGKTVYFVMYNKSPMGVKIENDTLGDVFHLLLDMVGEIEKSVLF